MSKVKLTGRRNSYSSVLQSSSYIWNAISSTTTGPGPDWIVKYRVAIPAPPVSTPDPLTAMFGGYDPPESGRATMRFPAR